jgi:predicted permease
LALGIGANTAIFTLVDAILLRWLSVPNPQELVVLARNPSRPTTGASYPDYCYLRDHSRSYAGLIAFWSGGVTRFSLPGEGSPQMVALALVSGNYFETLGVRPAIGRMLNPEDNTPVAHPYVVLSDAFWKRRFGGDTRVVGRDIMLNGAHFQVAGVARQGFTGTSVGTAPDVFAPILMERTFWPDDPSIGWRNVGWITLMGRLKTGVSRAQAEAELNVLWRQILENDPEERAIRSRRHDYNLINTRLLLAGSSGTSDLQKEVRRPLTILMIASAFVLLIACANVATLLLARGFARRREIAVRLAVGAARSRIIVQMLTESITLSVIGGVAGLALARVGVRILVGFLPVETWSPLDLDLAPDVRLLAFAFTVMVGSGILFGLAPALRASRPDLVLALKSSGTSSGASRFARWDLGRALVSLQVALSLVLLAGAGLFTRTLANLRSVDAEINHKNLVFIDTNIIQAGYTLKRARTFHERLRDQVQRLAGVQSATTADMVPFADSVGYADYVQTEALSEPTLVSRNAVTPRFFETVGIAILRGRDFRYSEPQPVAIVNQAFAHRFFGGQPAIGRRVCFGQKWDAAQAYEIVGLVADAHYGDLRKPVEPAIYRPRYYAGAWTGGTLCIRATADPKRVIGIIRRQVQEIDPALMVTQARTIEDNLDRALTQERFVATLGSFFGVVALLLAAVGLYGVMSQVVTRRTKEIGIRMAMGADSRTVLWMVLRDSLIMVGIGAAAGVPAVLVLTRYTESLLFGVKPQDPVAIAASGLLLLAVSALAAFLPALLAMRVQPMDALRQE